MLKLTKFCLFSFIVAIIEITWSVFDLVEEAVVFLFNSEAVGKFFIKTDRRSIIAIADSQEQEQLLTKSGFFYWLLLLFVIVVNIIWVLAAFKLMYGIIKVIFQDDRLRAVKCCRFWFRFSWLLLVIFAVKIFRNSSGFVTFVSAVAVVLYRGVSMYFVHCFAVELELAELLDPNPSIVTTSTTTQAHYNVRPGTSGNVSGEIKEVPVYEQPMAVFDMHRV